jgi:phage gpG-like protein
MVSVNVVITGDEELIAKLNKVESQISSFPEALSQIGKKLTSYYEDTVFNSMGGVFGTPWAKLAPSTVAQKVKHYRQYASVPLMATGRMRRQFIATSDSHSLMIRNDAPYFVYHQSTEPRSKIPRRQMMGINAFLKAMIQQIVKDDINKKIMAL